MGNVDGLGLAGDLHADASTERNVLATVEGDDAAAGASTGTSGRSSPNVEHCGEGSSWEAERRGIDICNRCTEDEGSYGEEDTDERGDENHGVSFVQCRIGTKIDLMLRVTDKDGSVAT